MDMIFCDYHLTKTFGTHLLSFVCYSCYSYKYSPLNWDFCVLVVCISERPMQNEGKWHMLVVLVFILGTAWSCIKLNASLTLNASSLSILLCLFHYESLNFVLPFVSGWRNI